MYEEYYGFAQPPFSLTPDPRFLYRSESHDIALQQVWQAIRRHEGFIVLTGDIGTGKTTLCRTILEQFDPTTFTALILDPFVSVEELLREVLLHYGIANRDALRTGRLATASKHELIRTLHDFLLSLAPIGGSAVLLIDEAQHLAPETLEEIRILSNLETHDRKLLQIVLIGQLNLLDVLHDAKLRQLDQRISLRCLLRSLTRDEVEAYIEHRLQVARGRSEVTFTAGALDRVLALSEGIPRRINLICDRALMAGARAQTHVITEELIDEGAGALGLVGKGSADRTAGDSLFPTRDAGGTTAEPAGSPSSARSRVSTGAFIAVILVALAVMLVLLLGRPAALLGVTPPEIAPPDRAALIAAPAVRAVPDDLDGLTPPPPDENAYSVVVGTFISPEDATAAERSLRARKLPVYAFDLRFADGRRRRLLVGRYPTREEAERVRTDLAAEFAAARVTLEWFERVR